MHRIHRHGMIHRDVGPNNILIDHYYGAIGFVNTPIGCVSCMPPEFNSFNPNTKTIALTQTSTIFPNLINRDLNPNFNYRPTAKQIKSSMHGFSSYLEHRIQFNPRYHQLLKQHKNFFCLSVYKERHFDIHFVFIIVLY